MRALFMLLLGYTAYRVTMRIKEENSSRLLLTDQRPDMRSSAKPATRSRSTARSSSSSHSRKPR